MIKFILYLAIAALFMWAAVYLVRSVRRQLKGVCGGCGGVCGGCGGACGGCPHDCGKNSH